MITHIQGKLVEKNPSYAIIDCNGVGYYINITINTYEKIPNKEAIKLFTHLIVREDSQTLYGFYDTIEREMFKLLVNVNGVGPSTARMVLSTLTPKEFQEAVVTNNVNVVKSVKGIGPKSAQRIIIELKDKLDKDLDINNLSLPTENKIKEEALNALEVLGFTKKQVEKVIDGFLKTDPKISVEELIKQTLKKI
ncbi:DNA helicase [Flavobacteriaceae bacterium UJ101]|nr:DNA helicase [Flavobacteriaceae bacterium UJ101]